MLTSKHEKSMYNESADSFAYKTNCAQLIFDHAVDMWEVGAILFFDTQKNWVFAAITISWKICWSGCSYHLEKFLWIKAMSHEKKTIWSSLSKLDIKKLKMMRWNLFTSFCLLLRNVNLKKIRFVHLYQ